MKKTLMQPKHPERICWGCDKYCSADDLACGNGTIRTPHPVELFGEDWLDWSNRPRQTSCSTATSGGRDGEGSNEEQGEGNAKDGENEEDQQAVDHEAGAACAWEAASG